MDDESSSNVSPKHRPLVIGCSKWISPAFPCYFIENLKCSLFPDSVCHFRQYTPLCVQVLIVIGLAFSYLIASSAHNWPGGLTCRSQYSPSASWLLLHRLQMMSPAFSGFIFAQCMEVVMHCVNGKWSLIKTKMQRNVSVLQEPQGFCTIDAHLLTGRSTLVTAGVSSAVRLAHINPSWYQWTLV